MDPTPIFRELITAAPWGAVVVIIVIAFLKFQTKMEERNREFLKQLHGEHIEARKESREVFREVKGAVADLKSAVTENTTATRDMCRAIRTQEK